MKNTIRWFFAISVVLFVSSPVLFVLGCLLGGRRLNLASGEMDSVTSLMTAGILVGVVWIVGAFPSWQYARISRFETFCMVAAVVVVLGATAYVVLGIWFNFSGIFGLKSVSSWTLVIVLVLFVGGRAPEGIASLVARKAVENEKQDTDTEVDHQ